MRLSATSARAVPRCQDVARDLASTGVCFLPPACFNFFSVSLAASDSSQYTRYPVPSPESSARDSAPSPASGSLSSP